MTARAPSHLTLRGMTGMVARHFRKSRDPSVKNITPREVKAIVRRARKLQGTSAAASLDNPDFGDLVFGNLPAEYTTLKSKAGTKSTASAKSETARVASTDAGNTDAPARRNGASGAAHRNRYDISREKVAHVLDAMRLVYDSAPDLDTPMTGYDVIHRFEDRRMRHPGRWHFDCLIVATAIACNVSYNESLEAWIGVGYKKDYRFYEHFPCVLRCLGHEFRQIHPYRYIRKINECGHRVKILTQEHTLRFPDVFTNPVDHNQIWHVRGHAFAFTGRVEDHWIAGEHKAYAVYDVFPLGQPPPKDESMYLGSSLNDDRTRYREFTKMRGFPGIHAIPTDDEAIRYAIERGTFLHDGGYGDPYLVEKTKEIVDIIKHLQDDPNSSITSRVGCYRSIDKMAGTFIADEILDSLVRIHDTRWDMDKPLSSYEALRKHHDLYCDDHPAFGRRRNDGAVVAVAIACNISYNRSMEALRKAGRSDNKRADERMIKTALGCLGFECRVLGAEFYIEKLSRQRHAFGCLRYTHTLRFPDLFSECADCRQIWFDDKGHVAAFTGKIEGTPLCGTGHIPFVWDVFLKGTKPPRDESVYERYPVNASGKDVHNPARGSGRPS